MLDENSIKSKNTNKNLKIQKLQLKNNKAKDFTCVSCPMGCLLHVGVEKSGEFKISGNNCKRGLIYGLQELKDPRRNISSTVSIKGAEINSLPVKTSKPIPKAKIFEVMKEINKIIVEAPVELGDIIIADVLHTGVDVISARTLEHFQDIKFQI